MDDQPTRPGYYLLYDQPDPGDGLGVRRYWWDEDCGWFGMARMATAYPSRAAALEIVEARQIAYMKPYVHHVPETARPPGFGGVLPTDA